MHIALADEDGEIDPLPVEGGGHKVEPELDRLSNIIKAFNKQYATNFTDSDRVIKKLLETAPKVAQNEAFRNAQQNTPHTARLAHDQALAKVMQVFMKDDIQLYKLFVENESFRRFASDMIYDINSQPPNLSR